MDKILDIVIGILICEPRIYRKYQLRLSEQTKLFLAYIE